MDSQELIGVLQDKIVEIYKEQNLNCIRGIHLDYKLNGREILVWHSDVTRKASNANQDFSYLENLDDIFFCSEELLYFTAYLFLYRPYINNPLDDGRMFNGEMVYPNYQNLESKRYSMYADVVSQKTYNFWDRIGDLLASYFPDRIKPHKVFFGTALDVIPEDFHKSDNYKWLRNFNDSNFSEVNRIRKRIVHYATSDTDYKNNHLKHSSNKEKMEKLQSERMSLPEFYQNQIKLTIEGFEKTLLLLEEFDDALFSHLP
ncbi:Cthe_2314 family HEPN domain-containing protein [Mucilaginibacter sp.]|uniref:Cthe_2314 family HEPN domain-containing protein n=1 Tax=Mucilaginibacter sp. TaxID=1882438 RepID=UPI000CB09FC5|nr:Cthe_2314 family HEPN domain-containing protein [Mucilaginibacter sp.]PLW90536.1 MAG: hypothetical protein C0154_05905 [Mucilaginibacter sp.]PMP66259.1 MAG: hypothetical protein C0191_01100 [Mucilaginibacter sp.]HEK22159.1 hypothetical protein [Bacteroidota bacterium]